MKLKSVKKDEVGKASQNQEVTHLLPISCILPVWALIHAIPMLKLYTSIHPFRSKQRSRWTPASMGEKGRAEWRKICRKAARSSAFKSSRVSAVLHMVASYFIKQRLTTVPSLKTLQWLLTSLKVKAMVLTRNLSISGILHLLFSGRSLPQVMAWLRPSLTLGSHQWLSSSPLYLRF